MFFQGQANIEHQDPSFNEINNKKKNNLYKIKKLKWNWIDNYKPN